jgi:hypothetical protein
LPDPDLEPAVWTQVDERRETVSWAEEAQVLLLGSVSRWVLVVVFSLAALEKIGTLRSKAAAWHPVLLVSDWRRRHAVHLLVVSLAADAAALILLVVRPALGATLAMLLVVAYTYAALAVHSGRIGHGCRCFWRVLNVRSRSGMVARNTALAILAFLTAASNADLVFGVLVLAPPLVVMLGSYRPVVDDVTTRRGGRKRQGFGQLAKGWRAGRALRIGSQEPVSEVGN